MVQRQKINQQIPNGPYCYDKNGLCPYWSKDPNKEEQNNGYCGFMKKGDWEFEFYGLLWDQVKECGVNIGDN
jgi:hypothetical protein